MISKLLIAIATVAFVGAFAAGCGSGSSEPLTKAAFFQQGNEICSEAAKQRDEDLKAAAEDGEMEAYVSVALDSVEEMAGELADLEPPKAQKKAVESIVRDLEREIKKLEADPSGTVSASAFEEANETSVRYGLPACAV